MKNLAFLLFYFFYSQVLLATQPTPCLIENGIIDPNGCPIGDVPTIQSPCIAPIAKYLSNSVRISGMWEFIREAPYSWNECYDENSESYTSCDEPIQCLAPYCPQRYCLEIQKLVELHPTFIFEAYGKYGDQHWEQPGQHQWIAAQQIVYDINAAYDCKGYRRPFIQATIFNHLDSKLNNWPIDIPTWVLDEWGNPPYSQFTYTDIINSKGDSWDVEKKLARMWVYYLARSYIDMGYAALHMGISNSWGPNEFENNWKNARELFQKIRDYAKSKGSVVLISGESRQCEKLYYTEGGTNYLIYDFDNIPLRPRELLDEKNYCPKSSRCYSTNTGIPDGVEKMYDGTPCETASGEPEFNAYIDPCILNLRRQMEGGMSPHGCFYDYGKVPYVVAFDFGNTLGYNCEIEDIGDVVQGDDRGVYCVDDMSWFTYFLRSRECAAYFIQQAICNIQNQSNGLGFIQLPWTWRGQTLVDENTQDVLLHIPYYRMSQDEVVLSSVQDVWNTNNPPIISYSKACENLVLSPICHVEGHAPPGKIYQLGDRIYNFEIDNPDCTSTYSWHVYNLDNETWLPYTYGRSRKVQASTSGNYRISVRQDNMLIQNSNGTNSTSIEFYLEEPLCCELIDERIDISLNEKNLIPFTIHPSPFNDNVDITFELAEKDKIDIELYDSQAKLIKKLKSGNYFQGITNEKIDLSELSQGIYYVRLKKTKSKPEVVKIVKLNTKL